MARKSYQKGSLQFHRGCWTVRYRYLNMQTGAMEMRRSRLEGCIDPRNKKAARRRADEFMIAVNQHNNAPRRPVAKLTFADFIATHWTAYLRSAKVQPSTEETYATIAKLHLLPALGPKTFQEITPVLLTGLFASLPEHLSPRYRESIYQLLHRVFEIARQYGVIDATPLRPVLHRPKGGTRQKVALSVGQLRLLIAAVPEHHRLLVIVVAVTGMRLGEVTGLRWMNFDATRRELSITHTAWRRKIKQPKTESSRRSFVLPVSIAESLSAHRLSSGFNRDEDLIFPAPDGRPFQHGHLREQVLYPALQRAGIERQPYTHGFHLLRHTAGSLLHKRTGDVKLVQELLGHARIETTSNIYVHVDDESRASATDILFMELAEQVSDSIS